MGDRILGAALLVLALAAAWSAQALVVPFMADPVGPRVLPTIVAAMLGACGIIIIVKPRLHRVALPNPATVALIVVAMVLYPLVLKPLGFVPATALLCFATSFAFGARPLRGAAVAVTTALALWLLLDRLLDLPLPRGLLGV